jgi:hypothetical protein
LIGNLDGLGVGGLGNGAEEEGILGLRFFCKFWWGGKVGLVGGVWLVVACGGECFLVFGLGIF